MTLRKFPFFTSIFFFGLATVLGVIQIVGRLACANSTCVNPLPFPEFLAFFGIVLLVLSFVPDRSLSNFK